MIGAKKRKKILPKIKNIGKNIVTAAKKIKQGAVTVNLAPVRGAFLTLILFNVHGWATGLSKMSMDQLKFWKSLGGDRTKLMDAIKKGAKRKRILGLDNEDMMSGIGEPVTIAGALTGAAPIIIKIQSLLDKAEKISKATEGITSTVSKTADAVKKADAGFKALTGKSVSDVIFKKQDGVESDKNSLSASDITPVSEKDANAIANTMINPPSKGIDKKFLYIGGAGLLAAAFLFSKRK
jgi:hypothetical protein